MPYGFSRDELQTRRLHEERMFFDRRSFVTRPLKDDGGSEHHKAGTIHFKLFGLDLSEKRRDVWIKADCKCKMCRREVHDEHDWELDHIHGGTTGRCECFKNLQPLCRACHTKKHGRFPRFGEGREQAIKDFDKVNP